MDSINFDVCVVLDAVSMLFTRPNLMDELKSQLMQGDPVFVDVCFKIEDAAEANGYDPDLFLSKVEDSENFMKYISVNEDDITFDYGEADSCDDRRLAAFIVPCEFNLEKLFSEPVEEDRRKEAAEVKSEIEGTYSFSSGRDMLETLDSTDLYNPNTGEYAFLYNESGSIAVYRLSLTEAKALAKKAEETGESWSALLGPGGTIYDDPSYEGFGEYSTSNEEYCNEVYSQKGWIECSEIFDI